MTVNEHPSAKYIQVLASAKTKYSSSTETYERESHTKPSHVFWVTLSTPYALETTTLLPKPCLKSPTFSAKSLYNLSIKNNTRLD
jgi:hypothetical protein